MCVYDEYLMSGGREREIKGGLLLCCATMIRSGKEGVVVSQAGQLADISLGVDSGLGYILFYPMAPKKGTLSNTTK